VRRLDPRALRAAMTTHTAPYTRILTDVEIDGVLHRRQTLLAYVDGLIADYGPDAVLAYP
jgi:hypothetical protein